MLQPFGWLKTKAKPDIESRSVTEAINVTINEDMSTKHANTVPDGLILYDEWRTQMGAPAPRSGGHRLIIANIFSSGSRGGVPCQPTTWLNLTKTAQNEDNWTERGAHVQNFTMKIRHWFLSKILWNWKNLDLEGSARVSSAPLNPPLMTQFVPHPLADHIWTQQSLTLKGNCPDIPLQDRQTMRKVMSTDFTTPVTSLNYILTYWRGHLWEDSVCLAVSDFNHYTKCSQCLLEGPVDPYSSKDDSV